MIPDTQQYEIRLATKMDIPVISQLIPEGEQRVGFGRTKISRDKFIEYIQRCILLEHHQTYLFYREDVLVSMMACYDSNIAPWWCALNFKVFNPTGLMDGFENGWVTMGDHIAKLKEAEGRYSFFYVKAVRNTPRFMERKIMQEYAGKFEEDGIAKRYTRTIEEFIPAGQSSKNPLFEKILIRGHKFVDDVVIIQWICLQQYRTGLPDWLQEQTLQFNSSTKF